MMSLAAAHNITQRKLNSYFVRASATSSQAMHPMGHFAATEMKLKRVTTMVEDFAFATSKWADSRKCSRSTADDWW